MSFWFGNLSVLPALLSDGMFLFLSTSYDLQHELVWFTVEVEVADMRVGSIESEVMVLKEGKWQNAPQVSLAQMEELKSPAHKRRQDKAGAEGRSLLQIPQCDVIKKVKTTSKASDLLVHLQSSLCLKQII